MNTISKSILDFVHFAVILFLALTTWNTLYSPMAAEFGVVAAAVVLLLLNIAFDLAPFAIGSHAAEKINRGHHWKTFLPLIVVACGLHAVSASISIYGADIAAATVFKDSDIAVHAQRADDARAEIEAHNLAAMEQWRADQQAAKDAQQRQVAALIKSHEAQLKSLREQSWANRDNNAEKAKISRTIRNLQASHEKEKAAILAQDVTIPEPAMRSTTTLTGDIAAGQVAKLQANQEKIAAALVIGEKALFVFAVAWYIIIWMVPELSGASMVLVLIGVPFYGVRVAGHKTGVMIDNYDKKLHGQDEKKKLPPPTAAPTVMMNFSEDPYTNQVRGLRLRVENLEKENLSLEKENEYLKKEIEKLSLKLKKALKKGRKERIKELPPSPPVKARSDLKKGADKKGRKKSRKPITEKEKKEILLLLKKGLSQYEVSKKVGRSSSVINRIAKLVA